MPNPRNITNNLGQVAAAFDYTSAQNLSNIAMGLGAEFTGQPYDVYRIGPSSTGDVIQPGNKVFAGYPIVREKYKPIKGTQDRLETDRTFAAYWYAIRGDMNPILVGDVLLQNDPYYGQGGTAVNYATDQINAICFGEQPPGGTPLGARLDRLITIYRVPEPPASSYNDTTFNGMLPLQLTAGEFALGSAHADTPCQIPAGFLPEKRARGEMYQDLGDVPAKVTQKIYVMPLPGFRFRAGDCIVSSDGSRYRVVNPQYQEVGAVGSQLICERNVEND